MRLICAIALCVTLFIALLFLLSKKYYFDNKDGIPRIIYLTAETRKKVPDKVFNNWQRLNPEYEIRFFDDSECYNYLLNNYNKDYADFFNEIPYGPIKSDWWRICVLYKEGGIYSDIDIEPWVPISDFIPENVTFCIPISCPSQNPNLLQAFIASTPNNPILKKCIHILYKKRGKITSYWGLSGTFDMFNVLKSMLGELKRGLNNYKDQKILLLQEVCPSGEDYYVKDINDKRIFNNHYEDYVSTVGFKGY